MSKASHSKRERRKRAAKSSQFWLGAVRNARNRAFDEEAKREAKSRAIEARHLEKLADSALLLMVDGVPHSGLVPIDGLWNYVERDWRAGSKRLFKDPVDAVLWLYAPIDGLKRRLFEFQDEDSIHSTPRTVEVKALNELGANLLADVRKELDAAYISGELDEDDLILFYHHFADASARRAIELRWSAEVDEDDDNW